MGILKSLVFETIVIYLLLQTCKNCAGESTQSPQKSTDLNTLLSVQVIFRHGARTIEQTFPSDPYGDPEFWPNGFHQLTCIGKVQCYGLGRFLRERYDEFLNSTYVRKEIHISSSNIDRTIQSAYSVAAGLYSPNQEVMDSNCQDIPWKDIPVHSIPYEIDNVIRQETPCPRYDQLLSDVYGSKLVLQMIQDNAEILAFFAKNGNFSAISVMQLSKYYDALIVERYFNLTLPEWTEPVLASPELRELTLFYFHTLTFSEEMKRFRAGPLFNKVIENFQEISNHGDDSHKMYLISGHDHTLTSFLDTLNLYSSLTRPTFAAAIMLELHKGSSEESDLEIRLFYKPDTTSDDADLLDIPNCPQPCLLQDFIRLVEPYNIDFKTWKKECQHMAGEKSTVAHIVMWLLVAVSIAVIGMTLGLFIYSLRRARRSYQHL